MPRAYRARVPQARQGVYSCYRRPDRHGSTRRRVGKNEKQERRRGSKPRSIEECLRASLFLQARLDSRIGIGAGKDRAISAGRREPRAHFSHVRDDQLVSHVLVSHVRGDQQLVPTGFSRTWRSTTNPSAGEFSWMDHSEAPAAQNSRLPRDPRSAHISRSSVMRRDQSRGGGVRTIRDAHGTCQEYQRSSIQRQHGAHLQAAHTAEDMCKAYQRPGSELPRGQRARDWRATYCCGLHLDQELGIE